MRTLKRLLPRIPRPIQTIISIVCVIALSSLYYIALGSPTLTFEQEFRRAEKANLVGPSRIVEVMDENCSDFDALIVGETEYGICFFGRKEINVIRGSNYEREEMMYTFSYREKTGDITVFAAPAYSSVFWSDFERCLPVYVFDQYPEATRAQLELTIPGSDTRVSNGQTITTNYSERFTATAERTGSGYFRFDLIAKDRTRLYALNLLATISGNEMYPNNKQIDTVIPGFLRLYDQSGNLIAVKEFTIVSTAAEAHK